MINFYNTTQTFSIIKNSRQHLENLTEKWQKKKSHKRAVSILSKKKDKKNTHIRVCMRSVSTTEFQE